ncbi:MAG TPA: dTMP kinase [Nitrospinota bacterium]|nr:dTMP kinase [Nitrospinota bacterium]
MGTFITFEGVEGCGKTTQIMMLRDYLLEKNYQVKITREPGGTAIGDQIRKILLNDDNKNISRETELLLITACRVQHIKEVIIPALKQDKVVLCDRFFDSTFAYQGYGRNIDLEFIKRLNKIVSCNIEPDLTILLDLDPLEGLKRANKRNSKKAVSEREERFEKETLEFHKRIRIGFLELAQKSQERIKVIDGNGKIEEIQKTIRSYTDEILR